MDWQPIDTAPRDGRGILTCRRDASYNTSIRVCWWNEDMYEGDCWMDDADSEPDPTHWMPIPSPPTDLQSTR